MERPCKWEGGGVQAGGACMEKPCKRGCMHREARGELRGQRGYANTACMQGRANACLHGEAVQT
eukprot:365727-Chlamydomonas_euryale.AAC.6